MHYIQTGHILMVEGRGELPIHSQVRKELILELAGEYWIAVKYDDFRDVTCQRIGRQKLLLATNTVF